MKRVTITKIVMSLSLQNILPSPKMALQLQDKKCSYRNDGSVEKEIVYRLGQPVYGSYISKLKI